WPRTRAAPCPTAPSAPWSWPWPKPAPPASAWKRYSPCAAACTARPIRRVPMHFMNLFLVACFYLALPIVYAMLLNAAKERNNLILAVTLPPEGRKDPEVAAVQKAFRKKLTALFVLLTVVLLPLLFVPWVSVVTLVCYIWLIAALVLPYVPFGKANHALKAMNRRR